mmetsp:Transcript_20185/g.53835  ORF Transcript_20185/g.53835 Transcript_20185/m.53835 type:complete len:556 (-) Transcript_20185:471-2138(-)
MRPREADGDIQVKLSGQRAEAANSMNGFIREHIIQTLQPFAENLHELRKALESVTSDLVETDTRSKANQVQIEALNDNTIGLRQDVDKVNEKSDALKPRVDKLFEESDTCKSRIDANTSNIERVTPVAAAAEALARENKTRIKEADSIVNALKASLAETAWNLENFAKRVEELKVDLSGTSLRIDEVDVTAQRTKTFAANHHSDFETFLKAFSLQKQKDERAFACTTAAIADVGQGQKDLVTRTEAQADHLKTTITMVKALKAKLDATEEDMKFMANHVKDGDKRVEQHAVELKSIHEILARLQGDLAAECGKDTTSIYTQVDKLTQRMQANEENIELNKESIADVNETVVAEQSKVVALEGAHPLLDSRLTQVELQVGMDLARQERQEKEASEFNERAKAKGWDAVTDKVKNFSIIARQKRDREKIEHAEHELNSLGGRLTLATSEFENMRESCQEALNMVRTMHKKVTELTEQQELTHEYWQGLSKGFRDTHRHIAIEKHLLPAKATTLPSLSPVSPNAPRALGESRHRSELPERPNSRGANRPRTPGSFTAR